MWLPTNTHRRMNSTHLRAQRVKQMPHKDHQHHHHLLGIFKDHRHGPIFLAYSRITGTVLSSWNIQGSPALSYLLGIFKDHRHCPIFLEYSRITGIVLSSWNIQGSPALSYLLGAFKDHWYCPIFFEYSRITGTVLSSWGYSRVTSTVLSSWNIQGSLALSYLLGIFKDHGHCPIFLEHKRQYFGHEIL